MSTVTEPAKEALADLATMQAEHEAALAALQELAIQIVDGTAPDKSQWRAIIQAAGKSPADLDAKVRHFQRRKELADQLSQPATQVAAARERAEQASREHAACSAKFTKLRVEAEQAYAELQYAEGQAHTASAALGRAEQADSERRKAIRKELLEGTAAYQERAQAAQEGASNHSHPGLIVQAKLAALVVSATSDELDWRNV